MIAIGDFTLGRGDPERDRVLLAIVARLAQRTRMIDTSAVDLVLVADGGFDSRSRLSTGRGTWPPGWSSSGKQARP